MLTRVKQALFRLLADAAERGAVKAIQKMLSDDGSYFIIKRPLEGSFTSKEPAVLVSEVIMFGPDGRIAARKVFAPIELFPDDEIRLAWKLDPPAEPKAGAAH